MVVFCYWQVTLAEHSPAESSVITVTATDKDSGENGRITYRVVSTKDMFHIDPNNGELSLYLFSFLVHRLPNYC